MLASKLLEIKNLYSDSEVNRERQTALRSHLECPICCEYMLDKIAICEAGHSVCFNCKKLLKNCPMCMHSFNSERNINLESIALLLTYPCRHEGCSQITSALNIRSHEKLCKFGPVKCILNDCFGFTWIGNSSAAHSHITSQHKDSIYTWSRIQYTHIYANACLYQEKTFIVFFKYLPDYVYYSAMYIGPEKDASKYILKLKFKDQARQGFKMSVCTPCNSLCKLDNIFNTNHRIVLVSREMKKFMDVVTRFYVCKAKIIKLDL